MTRENHLLLYTIRNIIGSKNCSKHVVPNMEMHYEFVKLVDKIKNGLVIRSAIGDRYALEALGEKFFGHKFVTLVDKEVNSLYAFIVDDRCLLFGLVDFYDG